MSPYPVSSQRTRGFTLIELAVSILVIGILLSLTDMAGVIKVGQRTYMARQEYVNKNIAATLLQYAKTSTTLGRLPAPYTGNGYYSTVLDPTNTTLASIFTAANIAPNEINTDGSTAARVRAYQTVTLTKTLPFDFQSGPSVTLTYDYATLYQTECMQSDTSCNVAPHPGASSALTPGNYATWTTTSPDLKPEFFSTLPLQQQMLSLTNQRLTELRDRFASYYSAQTLAGVAGATTNYFPFPYQGATTGTPNPDLSGATAGANQGCWDGWYNLNAANINLLAQLGLTKSQYATTAWGAQVEYCRDYDPALRGAGANPHYAALRFHQSLSAGSTPDTTAALTTTNNVFIAF